MIVVSNTSVLLNLAVIGRLDILHDLYGDILVPEAVLGELSRNGQESVGKLEWIKVKRIVDDIQVLALQNILDRGEAEAIILAKEVQADLVLIDEKKGRSTASGFGLKLVGLLGIVLLAMKRGMLKAVRPIIDELIVKAGFWISHDLYDRILQLASE